MSFGIDRMFLAVKDHGLDVHHRIAGNDATFQDRLDALFYRGKNELLIVPPKTSLANS